MTSKFQNRKTGEIVEAEGEEKRVLLQKAHEWLFLDGASDAEKAEVAAAVEAAKEEEPKVEETPDEAKAEPEKAVAPLALSAEGDAPAAPASEGGCSH